MEIDVVQALSDAMQTPSGLILVCGPTGQGKTLAVVRVLERCAMHGAYLVVDRSILHEPQEWAAAVRGRGAQVISVRETCNQTTNATVFMGDIRTSDVALISVELALRGNLVIATVRVPTAAAGFGRLIDMGVDARRVAGASLASFGLRLLRGVHQRITIFEKLTVSDAVRSRIASGEPTETVVRQSVAEGMKTLRQRALELVADGTITREDAEWSTPD